LEHAEHDGSPNSKSELKSLGSEDEEEDKKERVISSIADHSEFWGVGTEF